MDLRRKLDLRAAELRAQAWSESTWRTKASQWRKYIKFCTLVRCPPVPADLKTMCRYVVYLMDTLKYVSIQNYVSAVLSLNLYYGHDIRWIRSEFEFCMTMSGVRRTLGDPEPHRPTLTIQQLLLMSSHVDLQDPNQVCMWAAIVTGFRTLLRKSNLVPDTLTSVSGHYLRRGAVNFSEWGMSIAVSSSKTIQYAQRVHSVPITYAVGSPLCAVSLLKAHFRGTPQQGVDSPAFMISKGTGMVPLTYGALLKFLKALLRKAGLDSENVGLHSLRRAGALFMHNIGPSLEDIRQAGDWASMAALLYLAKPFSLKVKSDMVVSRALLQGRY